MPVSDRRPTSVGGTPLSSDERWFRIGLSTTFGKILLMALTLLMPNVIAAAINTVIWFILFPYLVLQIWVTITRNTGSLGGWGADNLVALIGLIGGIIIMVQPWFWALYSSDHHAIIMKCTLFGFFDLAFGLATAQRIAAATKERDEH
jgi:hypothetical protein